MGVGFLVYFYLLFSAHGMAWRLQGRVLVFDRSLEHQPKLTQLLGSGEACYPNSLTNEAYDESLTCYYHYHVGEYIWTLVPYGRPLLPKPPTMWRIRLTTAATNLTSDTRSPHKVIRYIYGIWVLQ